jgi:hypothetical protein
MQMSIEYCLNNTGKGVPKYSGDKAVAVPLRAKETKIRLAEYLAVILIK